MSRRGLDDPERTYSGRPVIARIVGLEILGVLMTASAISGVYKVGVVILEIVVLAVGAWLLIRSKAAKQAISNADQAQTLAGEWRENYLAERQSREDTAKEAAEQRELKHAALNEVAALRMSTDLTAVMTALIEIQKTGTKTVELLEKLMRRLDRDPPPQPLKEAA